MRPGGIHVVWVIRLAAAELIVENDRATSVGQPPEIFQVFVRDTRSAVQNEQRRSHRAREARPLPDATCGIPPGLLTYPHPLLRHRTAVKGAAEQALA